MLAACLGGSLTLNASAAEPAAYRVATFTADVTPPIGHACMGGGIKPAERIEDPLFVHGFVLFGLGKPVVLASVDWCEIRNDAHDRWREALAEAAGTVRERVLVSCIHQHDAPIADLEAQRILEKHKCVGSICDLAFHEKAVQRVARAVRDCLEKTSKITHIGTGQAKVEKVASNRRYLTADGKITFGRTSASRDPRAHEADEGTIDPWLKTLSFWDGDRPILGLSCYAVHPMSYYGRGGVSSDFTGIARKRRQADDPKVFQFYASGCSGNVTAGKFNDGAAENRPVLGDRIYQAMAAAWKATERRPIKNIEFRSVPMRLEPRDSAGFTVEDLTKKLAPGPRGFTQCLGALGLSWRKRADAGYKLDVPVLDFGVAQLVLMPAESYVEYQLMAQKMRPDSFVMVLGYGECAPGYIPTEKAVAEKDGNLGDWNWVAPGSERAMTAALEAALGKPK
ncbi:MAG: hypothetical protein FJ271_18070 [Planctomycetes bacterium]|nr:hypothetical protein [Planctomycetota bacterium]